MSEKPGHECSAATTTSSSWGATWAPSRTTPTRSRRRSTTRSAASSRKAHASATSVLRDHMEELHRLSAILIERETIDKDQFERLLAGESEESVFPEETPGSCDRGARGRRDEAQAAAAPDPGHCDAAPAARPGDLASASECSSLGVRAAARARLIASRSSHSGRSTTSGTTSRGRRASTTFVPRRDTAPTARGRTR